MFLVITLTSSLVHADLNHFGQWTGVIIQGTVTERWGWFFENQTRLNDGFEQGTAPDNKIVRNNALMVRSAIYYLPLGDDRLQFHLGYGWTPTLSPSRDESRIYEQLSVQDHFAEWTLSARLRLEQRWIENARGTSWRQRLLARVSRTISEDGFVQAVIWDEYLYNINDVKAGPKEGFNQNRIFVGPAFMLNTATRLELGYINVHTSAGRENTEVLSHIYALFIYLNF